MMLCADVVPLVYGHLDSVAMAALIWVGVMLGLAIAGLTHLSQNRRPVSGSTSGNERSE